ncbi:MAG TPA: hypothetical protein P5232_01065 [Candidatus Moranbacteria bacterium]|nr:hypothetical protein [Candidatus Moranbacteria bacterium]
MKYLKLGELDLGDFFIKVPQKSEEICQVQKIIDRRGEHLLWCKTIISGLELPESVDAEVIQVAL